MTSQLERLNIHLAAAKPSATYKMIDLVAERRAAGKQVISLTAGEPDFDTPAHVREAAIAAIAAGKTRYTQVSGMRELREAVAAKFKPLECVSCGKPWPQSSSAKTDWKYPGRKLLFAVVANRCCATRWLPRSTSATR